MNLDVLVSSIIGAATGYADYKQLHYVDDKKFDEEKIMSELERIINIEFKLKGIEGQIADIAKVLYVVEKLLAKVADDM